MVRLTAVCFPLVAKGGHASVEARPEVAGAQYGSRARQWVSNCTAERAKAAPELEGKDHAVFIGVDPASGAFREQELDGYRGFPIEVEGVSAGRIGSGVACGRLGRYRFAASPRTSAASSGLIFSRARRKSSGVTSSFNRTASVVYPDISGFIS